nr:hypothetical protein [Tanacetum cinerariifolium]
MMNPGLNTRFWTKRDVDRSKAFMFSIQKRLKKRRIFLNLESFVGGRIRDGDYRLLKPHTSDLPLSTSLNDLDNATLHIDGQSTEVDVLPDIIDVVDEDDDITNDEDALPHDLADSDNEDLINVDDDGVDKISADVSRSHDNDGGGDDRPLYTMYPAVAWVALLTEEITDTKGPVPIQFKLRDKQTVMPFGDHVVHWSSYIVEVIRGVPLYYPSWLKVPKERKTALIKDIE